MKTTELIELEKKYYANTFSRLPVAAFRGEGMYVYDLEDRKYLDMFAGIAVDSLGHAHPRMLETIKEQSEKLIHASNWLYTVPQVELAERLARITGMEKTFLTNDGTEAVEAAIKLTRKATGKKGIVAMEHAFHGRTLGSLSLTWGEKYRKPFMPLIDGMSFARYNDIESLKEKITKDTGAVILEPVQGEAGVILSDPEYLKEVRELTEEKEILLIVDEVQTGFGRTGEMFAFEHAKIKPDIVCMAKGMGGGFPIGAISYCCQDFEPGEHGGTFIGNPLASAVANTVIDTIEKEGLAENAKEMGSKLLAALRGRGLNARGAGLMIGMEAKDGKKAVMSLIENKVLSICSGNTVRLLPPLIIEEKHIEEFLCALDKADI